MVSCKGYVWEEEIVCMGTGWPGKSAEHYDIWAQIVP